jgi:uncharacterized protein (TIGR00299 family) protein
MKKRGNKMKTAYFDCFSGISGNMIVGAFLAAGTPLEYLNKELAKLPIHDEYELVNKIIMKQGISANYFDVQLHEPSDDESHHGDNHHHRHLEDIIQLIVESALTPEVKDLSLQIFQRLAEAEAKVHNCALDQIHFHEVGAVDAIIDIVGASICYHYLSVKKVYASPLHLGSGMVKCAHGLMPIPAPATAELLREVPIYSTEIAGELVTPTGAAIITTLSSGFGPMPPLCPEVIGYGAGTWDLPIPNVVRLYIGDIKDNTFDENMPVQNLIHKRKDL